MKNALVLLVILFIGQTLQAQHISLDIQSTEKVKNKASTMSFDIKPLGNDQDNYYFLQLPYHEIYGASAGNNQNYFVSKLSKDLKTYTKSVIQLESKKVGKTVEGVFYFNNQFIMVRSFEGNIIAQYIDKKSMLLDKKSYILGKIQQGEDRFLKVYNITISDDQSKLVLFYGLNSKKGIPQKFGAKVFDADLEEVWHNRSIEPQFQGGSFSFEDFRLTNNGDLYFVGEISFTTNIYYKDGGKKALKNAIGETYYIEKPGKYYQIYLITDEGENLYQVNLELPYQDIRNFNFCINEDQSITGYGIYCNKRRISAIGSFALDINFEKEKVENVVLSPFKEVLFSQGLDKRELEKYNIQRSKDLEWDPFNYDIGELKTKKDGTKYFVAEQWLKGNRNNANGSYTSFYLHDLYVVTLGLKNEVISQYKVHKRQFVPLYRSRCSYIDMEIDNKLYFIYTDLPRNNTGSFNAKNIVLKSLDEKGKEGKYVKPLKNTAFAPLLIADSHMKSGSNKFVVSYLCSNGRFHKASEITIITE